MRERLSPYLVHLSSLCLVIVFSATTARAISVSEYQQNVKRSITALDTLTQRDEDESESAFQRRFTDTLTMIRKIMPESQMVECGEELCTVDNTWLHDQLKELEKSSDSDWYPLLTHIIEQLKALDERVTELQKAGTKDPTKMAGKERLREILSRPEYATKARSNSALARILDDIGRWIAKLLGRRIQSDSRRTSVISGIAQVLVIGLALAVILYVLKLLLPRFLRRRPKKPKAKAEPRIVLGERLAPEASAVDLLAEAERLARDGEVRAAIRKAYIALLVELGDRNVISLAHHKTNRDYLRSVRNLPGLYPVMAGLTESFERHWYGFVQADFADWQSFRNAYQTALQTRA
ncbi:MAG TPA: DUF4129 domain-containing protein [Pyrinomonadaceae bacterium]|jgi:hypothetical protein